MPRIGITAQEIFQAAETLVIKGQTPTQDTIREYLGRGSRGTIHKYLKQWKQSCFQKGTKARNTVDSDHNQSFLDEKRDLEQIIAKQITQSEALTTQLVESEQEIVQLREKTQRSEAELKQLKGHYLELEAAHKALDQVHQMMLEERATAIQILLEDKNQQIEALKQELREVNQLSLGKLREFGFRSDEALIDEKVKVLNLTEKVIVLEKSLETAQQRLVYEQQVK